MFGLFRKKQLVTVVLPLTLDFYSVRDSNGRTQCRVVESARQVAYLTPTIKLTPRVRKLFDICDIKQDLRFDHMDNKEMKHIVEFSEKLWKNLNSQEKTLRLQKSVLDARQPYVMVPADKLLDFENAIDHMKNELRKEKDGADA